MNLKQKIYEYETRMEDDFSAYYDLLNFYKSLESEMVEDHEQGLDIKTKLKTRNELNSYLANTEPFEIEETDFYDFNSVDPDGTCVSVEK